MSWPSWSSAGAPLPAVVPTPAVAAPVQSSILPAAVNSAPSVMPPGMQYSAEQWTQMQQQNWQQWAQWQQQYQQWHQQYGAEYQKSMSALQSNMQPPLPATPVLAAAPPLPVEVKPPLPPEEPPINQPTNPTPQVPSYNTAPQNTFNTQQNRDISGYSTAPPSTPVQNPQYNQPPPNQNYAQRDNYNQYGGGPRQNWQNNQNKRPYNQDNNYDRNKRQMTEQHAPNQWGSNQYNRPNQNWQQNQGQAVPTSAPPRHNPEELSEAEKKFDKEFAAWEAQFNKWKDQNAGHPDKEQYREYEKKWESWRNSLLERREQMRRKRLGLTGGSAGPNRPPQQNQQLPNQQNFSQPPPGVQTQPSQQRKPAPVGVPPITATPNPPNQNLDSVSAPLPSDAPFSKPPPNINDEPLAFKTSNPVPDSEAEPQPEPGENAGDDFLKSSSTGGGIPGLDLVKEDGEPGNESEAVGADAKESVAENKGPDLEAISKGINTILGDQKLLSMLSMVSQNQTNTVPGAPTNTMAKIGNAPIANQFATGYSGNENLPPNYSERPPPVNIQPHNEQSNQSNEDRSNQGEYINQRESVTNFDDQTRSSFTLGPNDQEMRMEGGPNFGRPPPLLGRFPGRNDNFGAGRFGGPPPSDGDQYHNRNNFGSRNNFNRNEPNLNLDGNKQFDGPGSGFGGRPNFDRQDDFGRNKFNKGSDFTKRGNFNNNFNNMNDLPPRGGNFGRGPGNNFNQGGNQFNQRENQFNQGGNKFNQGANQFNQGANQFNQGTNQFNQRANQFNQGGNQFNQGGNQLDRGGNQFNLGGEKFNRGVGLGPHGGFNNRFDNTKRGNDYNERSLNQGDQGGSFDNKGYNEYDDYNQEEEEYNEENWNEDENDYDDYHSKFNEDEDVCEPEVPHEEPQPVPEKEPPPQEPEPEEPIFEPASVVDYNHKPLKGADFEVMIEPIHMFDYRHKPLNRIPLPQRPPWLAETVRFIKEFDPLASRLPINRFPQNEPRRDDIRRDDVRRDDVRREDSWRDDRRKEDDRRGPNFREDRWGPRGGGNRQSYGESRFNDRRSDNRHNDDYDNRRDRDGRREPDRAEDKFRHDDNKKSFDRKPPADDKYGNVRNPSRGGDKKDFLEEFSDDDMELNNGKGTQKQSEAEIVSFDNQEEKNNEQSNSFTITMIDELINQPGRFGRPARIVIILRGPPGSGKTHLAKIIKDKEVENGGSPPRILSLDDYFMVEHEKDKIEDGKTVKVKEMVYEYEAEMEESYRSSLMKSFKKTITDGYFPFIIVDNVNEKIEYFSEMWSFAKSNGFQVYICQMDLDPQVCSKRNIHGRSQEDIEECVASWEPTPSHYAILDATSLMQAEPIPEVEMEEVAPPAAVEEPAVQEAAEDEVRSKWDNFDCSIGNLAKLDGVSKPLRHSGTMEEYLQLEDEWTKKPARPGQKRVRWADLEECKQQEKMRAIGFVVGHTNWNRMMDPTQGGSALAQTKYFERTRRY